jgi:hypothetical protein
MIHPRFVVFAFAFLSRSMSVALAQDSADGQPWAGHWASNSKACEQVTCTSETDCDGTSYKFDSYLFEDEPGMFVCVIAANSRDQTGHTILPLACAGEGTAYTTAIQVVVDRDKLSYQWADESKDATAEPRFSAEPDVLQRCTNP